MRRAEYVLNIEVEGVPAGAHISPIQLKYIPHETKERLDPAGWMIDDLTNTYAFTAKGIMIIPWFKIRVIS